MQKTHTTFQNLVASTFNSHDETGDGVLWLGPVLFDGTVVTIGGYRVRYNGIIVEDSAIVTHDTAGYNYVCLAGIDASPSSAPYSLVTNVKQGVCLIEKYKEGWITRDNKFKGDFKGLPFTRTYDSVSLEFHACYGPGVCGDGTLVHTPIKLLWGLDRVSGTQAYPGVTDTFSAKNTVGLGTVSGYGCNAHLVIYSETVGTTIEIKNNKLYTTDSIAGVTGTCHAVIEKSDTHCNYAYSIGTDLYIGECEYGVAAGAATAYTLSANIARVDFVTPTTVVVQLADNTFIYGMIMPATIDTLFSGSSRWFHVDHKNGDFVHIGTDDKLYLNAVEIGSTTNLAFVFDKQILQVTSTGDIIHGGKTTQTGLLVTDVVYNRTTTNELFLLFINAAGVDAVSYNVYRGETTWIYPIGNAYALCAATFSDVSYIYLDSDENTYDQPVSPGSLVSDESIEIIPSEFGQWRFSKKTFSIVQDHLADQLLVDSNTTGVINSIVGTVNVGVYNTKTVSAVVLPVLSGAGVSDGDYFEYTDAGGIKRYIKSLAIDYDGETKSTLLTGTPTVPTPPAAYGFISGGIELSGGTVGQMNVYTADSVVYNMTITNLDIYIAKNVMFIGCAIGAYTDHAVAPDTNEYQFIGCTIAGIPVGGSFIGLTDTPAAYGPAGEMLITNGTSTGLEFSASARDTTSTFEFARQDMVNGLLTPAWDQPAASEINRSVKDPTGFEEIANCTINYSPVTRIVSLTFSGDTHIWLHGVRHKFTALHAGFPWIAHADTTNVYFFYLQDDGSGGLEVGSCAAPAFWDLSAVIPVTYVLYKDSTEVDGADGFHNEERHDNTWPWSLHRDMHLSRGAWAESGFEASGYVVNSSVEAEKKVTVEEGVIVDEDIWNTQPKFDPAIDTYPLFYIGTGNHWIWQRGFTHPVAFDTAGADQNPMYNDVATGTLVEITDNNRWFNSYLFATNSLDPDFRLVVIIGQTVYTSLAAASGESVGSLNLGTSGAFPFQESVALYQITWRRGPYSAALTNPDARIESFKRIVGERITVAGIASTSHATLTDRDAANCHPATAIGYDNNVEIQTIQVDVQSALDELYNINVDEASFTSVGPVFDAVYIPSEYTDTSAANDIVSCYVDIIGTVTALGFGSGGVALKDAFHRQIVFQAVITAGALTLLGEDETIYYEAAAFTAARLDPLTYLGLAGRDYVELHTDGSILVRGVSFGGASSSVRYAVRFSYNKVSHVPA